jgi:hypothetical protein
MSLVICTSHQERCKLKGCLEEKMPFKFSSILLTSIIILACAGCCDPGLSEEKAIPVPLGKPVNIDGIISPGEWDVAYVDRFGDESELFLMWAEEHLYLAIRGSSDEMIAANIFIEKDGEIIIHHTSAALGTGIYQAGDNGWLKKQDFKWQCRATDSSEVSQRERSEFLKNEGWLAANSRIGTPNELEYQIKVAGDEITLAVAFMRSSEPDLRVFLPPDLSDDTTKPTPGGLPDTRIFYPETWMLLTLSN